MRNKRAQAPPTMAIIVHTFQSNGFGCGLIQPFQHAQGLVNCMTYSLIDVSPITVRRCDDDVDRSQISWTVKRRLLNGDG